MGFTSAGQMAYAAPAIQPTAAVNVAPASKAIPPNFPFHRLHPFAYPLVPQFHYPRQQQLLQEFWCNQMQKYEQTTDYHKHSRPLARIRKIMKADEGVHMISSDALVFFAKACEIFIQELTLRSWIHSEDNRRMILQKKDIARAISRTHIFDFLVDIVPRDEMIEELGRNPRAVSVPGNQMPYCYMPVHTDPASIAAAVVAYKVQVQAQAQAEQQEQAQSQALVQVTQEAATAATSSSDALC